MIAIRKSNVISQCINGLLRVCFSCYLWFYMKSEVSVAFRYNKCVGRTNNACLLIQFFLDVTSWFVLRLALFYTHLRVVFFIKCSYNILHLCTLSSFLPIWSFPGEWKLFAFFVIYERNCFRFCLCCLR